MTKVQTKNGLNMFYEVLGEKGFPIFVIQGMGGDHQGGMVLRPALSEQYRVYSYDCRGLGQTEGPEVPVSVRLMADDLAELMEALKVEKAHIIGISLGTLVAQEFCINYPGKAASVIFMCSPSYEVSPWVRGLGDFWGKAVSKTGFALLSQEILHWCFTPQFFENNPEQVEMVKQIMAEQAKSFREDGFAAQAKAALSWEGAADRIHMIKCPALVMDGEQDITTPPFLSERLAKKLGAPMILIKNGAHNFFDENPVDTVTEVLKFLATVK